MPREREIKVGLLLLAAIAVLAGGIFLIGTQEKLFVRKNHYFIRFDDVDGLAPGGVVDLNGVNVGKVEKVVLPDDPARPDVVVWVEINRLYARRLRAPAKPGPGGAPNPAPAPRPTTAELKTQGVLGDKYVALTLGAPQYPPIPEDGEIAASVPVSVDKLLASGGDLMGQVKQIVRDLKDFTGKLNQNGGLVPRLVTDQDYGREVSAKLRSTLDNLSKITGKVAGGEGTLGKLVEDPSVYNGLSNVVTGVNQNGLLRRLIQNREKAGAKAKAAQNPQAKPPQQQPPQPPRQ